MTYDEIVDAIYTAYGKYVSRSNVELLVTMSVRLGLDPGFVADLIAHESKFNPEAKNPDSSASGIIQFIEATANGLGTTSPEILTMSFSEQVELTERYYLGIIGTYGSLTTEADTYMAVFYPAAIGKPDYAFNSSVTSVNKSTTVADYVNNVRASADRYSANGRVGPLLYPQGVWELNLPTAVSVGSPWYLAVVAVLAVLGVVVAKKVAGK